MRGAIVIEIAPTWIPALIRHDHTAHRRRTSNRNRRKGCSNKLSNSRSKDKRTEIAVVRIKRISAHVGWISGVARPSAEDQKADHRQTRWIQSTIG
jgi:hypothetical protein